ncbi:hypothetical protein COM95_16490 [Bacillus cereus]|nr:hypothetical protein COM95_16490 [Bacillus cereus]PFH65306.1 hypothetical protein COI61_30240 [Bacillus cereus]
MGYYEKEHTTKSAMIRPLVVSDIVSYKDHDFLVVFLYEDHYTTGQIIVPTREIQKDGISIADKLKEIVRVNCGNLSEEISFDLLTCNETIFADTLKDPYILTQLKPQQDCSECQGVMQNESVQEALNDLYISEYESEIKESQQQERENRRSIRNVMRRSICKIYRDLYQKVRVL